MAGEVRAAGGLVWRDGESGTPHVALIYRDRYHDWTLPKGKLHNGERELAAAVREVHEETGARVAVTRRLIRVQYTVEGNIPKSVMFWAMRYLSGEFTRNSEIDDFVWLPIDEAYAKVSYHMDRSVIDAFRAQPIPQSVVVLARHTKAGRRTDWSGDDRLRPLEPVGRRQAHLLASFLLDFAPQRILAADRTRCVQTMEPLAQLTGAPLEIEPAFADEAFVEDPMAAQAALLAVAKSAPSAAICSQGVTIPGLVRHLAAPGSTESFATRKGGAWVLAFTDGTVISADYYGNAAR